MTPCLYKKWMTLKSTRDELDIQFFETPEEAKAYDAEHSCDFLEDVRELIGNKYDVHAILLEGSYDVDDDRRMYPGVIGVYKSIDKARRAMWKRMGHCIDRQHVVGRGRGADQAFAPWEFRTEGLRAVAISEKEEYIWRVIDFDEVQRLYIDD